MGFLAAELTLRTLVQADPSYYVAFSDPEPGKEVQYAYGKMRFNSAGYADAEFSLTKTKPRVGYVGDSVCFGVGAGYGYRISEVLEEHYPDYEHMNFTGGLNNDPLEVKDRIRTFDELYDVDVFVYLMTLTDIKPTAPSSRRATSLGQLKKLLDAFRGRSYLYTYMRQVAKGLFAQALPPAYDLFPERHSEAFRQTAARLEELTAAVHEAGDELIVVLLPTEIQISADAARAYRGAGIVWDDGTYPDRGAQRKLLSYLDSPVVVDAYYAFIDPEHSESDRNHYGAGECFVYNRGERLDWIHPNRLGHRLIADYVAEQKVLDRLNEGTVEPSGE
jgi:hypothetical protein